MRAVQGLRDQVAQWRAETDKELKRRERLEREMKELVGGVAPHRGLFGGRRGDGRMANGCNVPMGGACRVLAAGWLQSVLLSGPPTSLQLQLPMIDVNRLALRPESQLCHDLLCLPSMKRAALEARQQDIRDKQLAVQQSTEYIEKLKVGCTAAPAAK